MFSKSVLNAEKVLWSSFIGRFFLKVYAEGADDSATNESQGEEKPINFEQLIAQARKEEKDKLYPRLQKAEEEVKTLTKSLNGALLEKGTLQARIDELSTQLNSKEDSKEAQELKKQVKKLEEDLKTAKESAPNEASLREEITQKLTQEFEVKRYLDSKIAENKESILAVFIPNITGTTVEEVDESVNKAKESTLAVKKDLGLVDDKGEDVTNKNVSTGKKTAPPAAVPSVSSENGFDLDYVRNLDPKSPEYKEFRKKMGLN